MYSKAKKAHDQVKRELFWVSRAVGRSKGEGGGAGMLMANINLDSSAL
jgi:hypothetical protein